LTWPGETGPPAAAEQETEIKPPPVSPRAAALRQAARRAPGEVELLVLGLLEVAAAVDRLTHTLRRRSSHEHDD
jgi:hypothetical protein